MQGTVVKGGDEMRFIGGLLSDRAEIYRNCRIKSMSQYAMCLFKCCQGYTNRIRIENTREKVC